MPLLEDFLRTIARGPDDVELAEREALVAAIHDLGGDDRAASSLWREPIEEHPEALAAYGRTLHRLMGEEGMTVSELAGLADATARRSSPSPVGSRKRVPPRRSGSRGRFVSPWASSSKAWRASCEGRAAAGPQAG